MLKSVNEITTDNLKNLLKIVIIGFITLDFFSPLTFRFIASFFSEGHEMKWAFIVFRVIYLSTPLLLVLLSLIHKNKFSTLINYYDVKEFKNTLVYLYITAFCIILFIILSLSAFVILDFVAADVLKAELLIFGIIFLFLFFQILWQLHIRNKIKYQSVKSLVSGLLIIEILFILVYFTYIKGNLNLDEKPYNTFLNELYYQPFSKQIELDSISKSVDSLKNFNYSVDELATIISTKSILFHNANSKNSDLIKETAGEIAVLNSMIEADNSREIDTSHPDKHIYSKLNSFITILNGTELTSDKLKRINRISSFIRRGSQIVLFQAEINYEVQAKKAKESAVLLLRFEQLFEVFIVLFIIVVLSVAINLLSKFKSQNGKLLYVKTTLIVYVLIFFQLMKPIDPRHIDINDAGWPFTQANWYLPGYIQSIGSITNNYDQSTTDESTNKILGNEQEQVISSIKDLTDQVDSIDDNLSSFQKKLNKELELELK